MNMMPKIQRCRWTARTSSFSLRQRGLRCPGVARDAPGRIVLEGSYAQGGALASGEEGTRGSWNEAGARGTHLCAET
jgi:hypothetical protein